MHCRLRFQFGLRSLLLLTTVLGVWLGVQVNRAREQREAVAAIEQWGGWCEYDFDPDLEVGLNQAWWRGPLQRFLGREYSANVVSVDLLPNEKNLSRKFSELRARFDRARDEAPRQPNKLHLRIWHLHEPVTFAEAVDDEGLRLIGALGELQSLSLRFAEVGDEGISHLLRLKQLKILDLECCDVTDAGVARLVALTGLEKLSLRWTRIGDAGIAHLKRLYRLQHLDLTETDVSPAGVADLQKALPDCEISALPEM